VKHNLLPTTVRPSQQQTPVKHNLLPTTGILKRPAVK